MKDAWDKFKISSDALKANWPLVLLGLTAVSSGITNISQYFDGVTAQKNYHEGITAITQHEKPKGCSRCIKLINELKEFH